MVRTVPHPSNAFHLKLIDTLDLVAVEGGLILLNWKTALDAEVPEFQLLPNLGASLPICGGPCWFYTR